MAMIQPLILSSPAKINLYLAIIGKRGDGYHALETFMQKLVLADEIIIEPRDRGIHLHCPDSRLPENEQNIAYRAAEAIFHAAASSQGVAITIAKRIPIAAGLGGGSSNAATVLKGINQLYGFDLSSEEIFRLGRELGADVPFFLGAAGAAWAGGIGEMLYPVLHATRKWVVLVNPEFPVSTKWVYENFKLTTSANAFILKSSLENGWNRYPFIPDGEISLFNDLESVTLSRFPQLRETKDTIREHGAEGVLMSGSGPTIFGLFSKNEKAQACFDSLHNQLKSSIFLTTFLSPQEKE